MRRGRYYLGRVNKTGEISQSSLMDAITNAPTVELGRFEWTITDVVDRRDSAEPFVYGNLSKYSRQGEVTLVDEPAKRQLQTAATNLLEASSPFVYLPDLSGIAFLHVWNGIPEDVFARRFQSIVEEAHDRFFVRCEILPIIDFRHFVDRLKSLDKIMEISATVHPPNPLFGRLWESLEKYVRKRNADQLTVKESTGKSSGLMTNIVAISDGIINDPTYEPSEPASITDGAILMAVDGYGSGKVVGIEGGTEVVIRTSENEKSFLFDKEPDVDALAAAVREQFERVSEERDMRHGQ